MILHIKTIHYASFLQLFNKDLAAEI